jgi:hypothetical protein
MNSNQEFNPYAGDGAAQAQSVIHDGTSKALAIVGCVLGAMGFGGVIVGAILLPSLVKSEATASSAYSRESSQTAEREARVSLEQVDKLRNEFHDYLGINVPVKTALKGESK